MATWAIRHTVSLPQPFDNLCHVTEANASIFGDIFKEDQMCSAVTACEGDSTYCRHITIYDSEGNVEAQYWCEGWS